MNKATFIDILKSKLSAKGIPETEIRKYVDKYNSFFESVDDDEFSKEFNSENDVDEIVSVIIDNYALQSVGAVKAPVKTVPPDDAKNASDKDNLNKTIVFDADKTKTAEISDDENEVRIYGTADLKRIDESVIEDEPKKKKAKKKVRKKVKGSPLFWTLFIITLPITVPLICAFTILIGALYIVVTAAIAASIGCMLVTVAAGTASALTGIINGIIKIFSLPPVGIYELGLGLIIGGCAIILSLIVYIVTVKLLPKLFVYITKFAGFVYGKIGDLFYNCKVRCAK